MCQPVQVPNAGWFGLPAHLMRSPDALHTASKLVASLRAASAPAEFRLPPTPLPSSQEPTKIPAAQPRHAPRPCRHRCAAASGAMLAAARCLLASSAAGGGRACLVASARMLLTQPVLRQLTGTAAGQVHCILPPHPPAPPELSLCSVEQSSVPAAVWQLLAGYFPDRASQPPTCLSITSGLDGCEACTRGLQAAGFGAVTPLVLRRQATGGLLEGHSGRCCLELPSSGAAQRAAAAAVGAASPQQQQQRRGFDAIVLGDCCHLLDTRRALQARWPGSPAACAWACTWPHLPAAGQPAARPSTLAQAAHRHLRPLGLLAVIWTDRSLADPLCLDLEELLEGHVPGGWRATPADLPSLLQGQVPGLCSGDA